MHFYSEQNMTLEERISRLEDIEAIRYLQAKYQRCLDTRDFDALAECFAEQVVSSYGNGDMTYHGKDNVMQFLRNVMTLDMPSTHLIHGGEIDIISPCQAKAKWYLEDHLLHEKYLIKLHGAAIYDVEYTKLNNQWLIMSIGYKRCYEYMEGRSLLNILTLKDKTFLKEAKKNNSVSSSDNKDLFKKHLFNKNKKD